MTVNPAAIVKLALLIDGDNLSASYMPLIASEAERLGTLAVRRIYGQFKTGEMKSWLKHLEEFELTPVNVSPLTKGKNATDMKLVIEAMDMLNGRQFDGFCIASSDGDFTPLAARIRANAVACYGFGAKKAPAGYKAEFDRFFECDTLLATGKKAAPRRVAVPAAVLAAPKPTPRRPTAVRTARPASPKSAPQPQVTRRTQSPARAPQPVPMVEVLKAVEATRKDDGWSSLSAVGSQLQRTIAGFNARNYGHRSMSKLIEAIPELRMLSAGRRIFVRRQD